MFCGNMFLAFAFLFRVFVLYGDSVTLWSGRLRRGKTGIVAFDLLTAREWVPPAWRAGGTYFDRVGIFVDQFVDGS